MHAYLIVGGSKEARDKKLEAILSQKGVGRTAGERFNLGSGSEDSLKIEDVREAAGWIGLARKKLAGLIVEEADRLTLPAQHAFLKTLEEPGDNILIVLTSADTSGLLPTVRSRCRIIRLAAAPLVDAENSVKFAKLNAGSVAERLVSLYPILKQITGSGAGLHRGKIKREDGLKFLEEIIASLRAPQSPGEVGRGNPVRVGMALEAAVSAYQRLKNNLNPTLALHQFVMDISL